MSVVRRRIAVVVTVVALGLGVATLPAGAGTERPTPKQWATSMCTSVRTWLNAVEDTLGSLKASDSLRATISTATDGISDATRALVHDLDDLGLPRVKHGKQAQAAITKLGNQLERDLKVAEDALGDSKKGPLDLAGTFAALGDVLGRAIKQVSTTAKVLQDLDRHGELRTALTHTPACTALPDAV